MNIVSKKTHRHILSLLLVLLTLSPTAQIIAASENATNEIDVEPRLSEILQSPLRADLVWSSDLFNPVARQTMHQGPKQKNYIPKSRLQLLNSLQFLNKADKRSVLNNIDRTITSTGKGTLLSLLDLPITNWKTIKARQNFIRTLIEKPNILKSVQEQLLAIKKYEDQLFNALKETESLFYSNHTMYVSGSGAGDPAAAAVLVVVLLVLVISILFSKRFDSVNNALIHGGTLGLLAGATAGAGLTIVGLKELIFGGGMLRGNPGLSRVMGGLLACSGAAMTVGAGALLSLYNHSLKKTFAAAQGTAQVYRHSMQLHENLLSFEETQEYYQELFDEESKPWETLIKKLQKATFNENEEPTLLFTHHGRASNVVRFAQEAKNELGTILRFYGELDAYQSIAQFYLDHQTIKNDIGQDIRCCLVDFIDDSSESTLHTNNFWHPMLASTKARASSLDLGGSHDKPRNLVITGPNQAGKSVNLKSLLVNLILAQTFGIACAESWAFTPFTKIIARLTSPDDTANDKSKFMLEAIEMTELLKEVSTLKPDEHAFVVTDELFTGTEVGPAISLSMELCAEIGKMKNVMYLLATHYKQLTNLKYITNDIFDNYKVSVFRDPSSGKLMYPYTLSKGVGNTNVAFDIFLEQLEEQGVNNPTLVEIIKNAKARQQQIEEELDHTILATETTPTAIPAF